MILLNQNGMTIVIPFWITFISSLMNIFLSRFVSRDLGAIYSLVNSLARIFGHI
jgi:hypothetical protein